MPKVRITFSPLADPKHSRQVTLAEENRPETEEVIVERSRKATVQARLLDFQASVLGVWVLDENGERIPRSRTEFTWRPTGVRAAGAEVPEVAELATSQEGDVVTVAVVSTTKEPTLAEAGGTLPIPDSPGVEIAMKPDGTGGNLVGDEATEEKPKIPDRVVFEVRTAPEGETDPSNAIEVAHEPTTEIVGTSAEVPMIPNETKQEVFTRVYDPASDAESPWVQHTIAVQDAPDLMDNGSFDFEDAWGSATIEQMFGLDTMTVAGSEIQNAAMPSMFADGPSGGFDESVFSMDDGASMWSMADLFPYGRLELPEIDNGKDADFMLQAVPEVTDQDRITERSIFAECYQLFRSHEAQIIQQQEANTGVRPVAGGDRDISMFGTRSDGSPIRVIKEIKTRPDGGSYGPYKVIRRPSQVHYCRYHTPRLTLLSHRGLRCPKLRRFWWRRRRWNRKWEYEIPYNPAGGPGTAEIFPIPAEVLTVFNNPRVNVSVVDQTGVGDVSYDLFYDPTVVTDQLNIWVEQVVRGQESAVAGVWSATFPKTFGAVPHVALGPSDATNKSFAGFGGVTTAGITAGYLAYPGGPGNEGPLDGAGTVDYLARGAPKTLAQAGDLKLAIVITGA